MTSRNTFPIGFIAVACCLVAAPAFADEEPAATPYRPTVSNPADLPVPGWLELELGAQRERSDDGHVTRWPYLAKYAFTPDWGVLVGGAAYTRGPDAQGQVASGFGDTQLLLKHRIPVAEGKAFGFETGLRLPTAGHGLGSDKTDYVFNGIFSADLAAAHLDINLGPTWIGAPEPDTARLAWSGSAALSKSIGERWSVAGELSGTTRRRTASESQGLVALAYSASKRTVLDVGAARGLTDASPKLVVFAGVTSLLAQLR